MFKIGDEVISKKFGKGTIANIYQNNHYPIGVIFNSYSYIIWFTNSGKHSVFENNLNKDIIKVEKPMQVTRSEVFSELARVSKMIEGTDLTLTDTVKLNGCPVGNYLSISDINSRLADKYTFALAIVEGKPVFVGDTLYDSIGEFTVAKGCAFINCTWNKPKRTFLLNGEELPKWNSKTSTGTSLYWFDVLFIEEIQRFQWDSAEDRDQVQTAILKLLNGEQ